MLATSDSDLCDRERHNLLDSESNSIGHSSQSQRRHIRVGSLKSYTSAKSPTASNM